MAVAPISAIRALVCGIGPGCGDIIVEQCTSAYSVERAVVRELRRIYVYDQVAMRAECE